MQHDDDQSGDEEEDHVDDSHNHVQYAGTSVATQSSSYGSHNSYRQSNDHNAHAGDNGGGLYRWGKPNTMPSLAPTMRAGDYGGAATSFTNFAAHRRPSASIA
jgi:hypothetical protein